MGKQKIKMEKIEEEKKRQICFSKRRKGLLSKAEKLCSLGCHMAIIIFSAAGQAFTFGNPSVHQIVSRYLGRTIEPPNQGLENSEADDDDDDDDDNDNDDDDDDVDDDDDDEQTNETSPMAVPGLPEKKRVAKRRKLENSEEEQQKQQLAACQDKVKNSPIINTSERSNNCIATVNDHHEEEKNKNSISLLALDNSKDEGMLLGENVENQSEAILIQYEKNNNCNTSSGSEEKEQMENNSNTCRDELSACEKEGDQENKQFFWNEAVENLNLDQLLKLEEIIKEKQSKVVKLADKILEERPLRLCSWVDTDEEKDKS